MGAFNEVTHQMPKVSLLGVLNLFGVFEIFDDVVIVLMEEKYNTRVDWMCGRVK